MGSGEVARRERGPHIIGDGLGGSSSVLHGRTRRFCKRSLAWGLIHVGPAKGCPGWKTPTQRRESSGPLYAVECVPSRHVKAIRPMALSMTLNCSVLSTTSKLLPVVTVISLRDAMLIELVLLFSENDLAYRFLDNSTGSCSLAFPPMPSRCVRMGYG